MVFNRGATVLQAPGVEPAIRDSVHAIQARREEGPGGGIIVIHGPGAGGPGGIVIRGPGGGIIPARRPDGEATAARAAPKIRRPGGPHDRVIRPLPPQGLGLEAVPGDRDAIVLDITGRHGSRIVLAVEGPADEVVLLGVGRLPASGRARVFVLPPEGDAPGLIVVRMRE